MTEPTLDSRDLPFIANSIRAIGEIERTATDAATRDGFTAQIVSEHCTDGMTAEDRWAFRRLCLAVLFRKIELNVRHCKEAGVQITGYEDRDAWIDVKLALLNQKREIEPHGHA